MMYQRYFLRIAYDGTEYHGWQRQPNGNTVQEEVEKWLCRVLHLPRVITTGCGRTDAGVHAKDFYLHFNPEIEELIPREEFLFKLGNAMPKDIAVYDFFAVHPNAHTRFDAVERSYEYHLHLKRNPFNRLYSTHCFYKLDFEKMNEAAKLLIFKGDFAAFSRTGGGQRTTICDVRRAEWQETEMGFVFHISADRFLRNMVRAVVGTLAEVGKGRMTLEEFKTVIDSGQRTLAGDSMRPEGLHLSKVLYPYIRDGRYVAPTDLIEE